MPTTSSDPLEGTLKNLSRREYQEVVRLLREAGEQGSRDPIYRAMSAVYEEIPVPMTEFLYSPQYLGLGPYLWPKVKDLLIAIDDPSLREVYLLLGRGSGKSEIARITLLRQIYRLLCFRDPHAYLQLNPDTGIAVMNMSVKGEQAEAIIFKGVQMAARRSPWFTNRLIHSKREMEFQKNVHFYCGNSSAAGSLGYNTVCAVLDEVDAFKRAATGDSRAQDVIGAMRGAFFSRSQDTYKFLAISSVQSLDGPLFQMVHDVKQRGVELEWEGIGKGT